MKLYQKVLLLFIVPYVTHAIPDYWPGRTYTSFNGTQHAPVPITMASKITEYNEKATPRDDYLKTSLSSYTLIDLWDKTNDAPQDKGGTVINIKNFY